MNTRKFALGLVAALATRADAHGAGVWKDPKHYVSDERLAGTRFISEFPAHTLTMVTCVHSSCHPHGFE